MFVKIIKITAIFLDNYVIIYFLAMGIKTQYTSKRYLCKVACSLLSLMNERAEPNFDLDTLQGIDAFIDSQDPDNTVFPSTPLPSPTFYTMLHFQRAFCEYAFNDNWRFLLQNDPFLGPGTFGQCARMMAERCAVMHDQLEKLKGDGWQALPEFKKYLDAVSKCRESDGSTGDYPDQDFFLKRLPKKFIEIYETNLKKHLFDCWLSDGSTEDDTSKPGLLHYLLAGDPVFAKEFAKMLVHYKEQHEGTSLNNDNEEINNTITKYNYSSTPEFVELGEHHIMFSKTAQPIKLNVKNALEFITEGVKWQSILDETFVKDNWSFIEKMAHAEEVVRLFDVVQDDGKSFAWFVRSS